MHAQHDTANCLSEIPQLFFFAPRYARNARCARRTLALRACGMFHCSILSEIPQLLSLFCSTLHDMGAARAAPSRIALKAAAPPCSIHVLSRFALVLPLRACAGRMRRHNCARAAHGMRTATAITCADLGANAGYVVLRARLRAHECALAIVNEHG
jgi:hypothetical protein